MKIEFHLPLPPNARIFMDNGDFLRSYCGRPLGMDMTVKESVGKGVGEIDYL
jgi:hypothetical protein